MKKIFDSFLIFVGSILTICLMDKVEPGIIRSLEYLNMKQETQTKALGALFSFIVVIIVVFLNGIKKLFCWVWLGARKPRLIVEFRNEKDQTINKLDFTKDPEEPQYLRIVLRGQFNSFQYTIINLLKMRIYLEINPRICTIELNKGYIESSEKYIEWNQGLIYDLFSDFRVSKQEKELYIDLNLKQIHLGRAEILVKPYISRCIKFLPKTSGYWMKITVPKFEIIAKEW